MKSETPWAEACKAHPELNRLLCRQKLLASLDRELTANEDEELTSLNKQINNWRCQLGLE